MGFQDRFHAVVRSRWGYLLLSPILLLPCYWQPQPHAGDLSRLLYNSWSESLVESGRVLGSGIIHRSSGLFDLLLAGVFRITGAELATRAVVSLVVLIFIWGAFAFVATVGGSRPWHLLPCFAMLAYGWVFHMGFFSFYLSLGLCFWAMALAWKCNPWQVAAACPFLVAAYLAHPMPVVWTINLLIYVAAARNLSPFGRALLTTGFVLSMLLVRVASTRMAFALASPGDFDLSAATGSGWFFSPKYYLLLMGLVAFWGLLFLSLIRASGVFRVLSGIPFQLCLIGATAVFLLPFTVLIPGFYHAVTYVSERMSMGLAVCICALLGAVPPRRFERYALIALAFAFFLFVWADERAVNSRDDQMQDRISLEINRSPIPCATIDSEFSSPPQRNS